MIRPAGRAADAKHTDSAARSGHKALRFARILEVHVLFMPFESLARI